MYTTAFLSNGLGSKEIHPSWYNIDRYDYCEDFMLQKEQPKRKNIFNIFKKNK